jgi:hypothetical protein
MKDSIDSVVLGSISGAVGGIVGLAFSYSMFLLGFSPISSLHLAATLVVVDILKLTPLGVIDSIVAHLTVAAAFGVILTYMFRYTGKEYWVLKGIGAGALFCIITHSYFIPLMRSDEQVRSLIFNPPSWATMVTTHSIIGLVTAFMIVKYFFKKEQKEADWSKIEHS